MTIQLELWQFIMLTLTVLSAFFGLAWRLLAQFERRIGDRLTTLADESKGWRRIERELMELRADLPSRYVQREDYIRNQTIIEAKLDAISSKVELVQLQGARRD